MDTATLHYAQLTEDHFKIYTHIILQRIGGNSIAIDHKWIEKLKKLKESHPDTKLIYTIDDRLMSPIIKELILISDFLLLPNKNLGIFYQHLQPKQFLYTTFIDVDTFNASEKIRTRGYLNILWASTALLGSKFLNGILNELKYFPNIKITVMGHREKERWDNNLHIIPIQKYGVFCGYFMGADLVLNPCEWENEKEKEFVDCKSAIKYTHAGLAKSLMLSSKTFAYEDAIKDYENGILLDNDKETWLDVIEDFIKKQHSYEHITDKAHHDVIYNYSLSKVSKDIFEILKSQ